MPNDISYKLKISELAEKLEGGCTNTQLLKEYMPKWAVPRRTLERYISLAQDIVSSRLKKREAVIEAVRADIIAHEAETWLKSNLELEARLCAIVTGKIQFEKMVKSGDKSVPVKCRPSCAEVIDAIDLLLRLRGVYKAADGKSTSERPVIRIILDNEKEKEIVEKILNQGKKKER